MRKLLFAALLAAAPLLAVSGEITTCRAPAGKAYFHFAGLTGKADAGWSDDKLSAGVFTLQQDADSSFDILYVDVRKKPISSKGEGATIIRLRSSKDSITFLLNYPTSTDIYTFFRETDGTSKFSMLTSRSGAAIGFPKSSLLVGECEPIRFDSIVSN